MDITEKFNTVLAIQNYGNSGTLFIQSLLDGHPQLISLPGIYGQQLLPFYERNQHVTKNDLIKNFLDQHEYWFSPEKFPPLTLEHGLMHMRHNKDYVLKIEKNIFTDHLVKIWLNETHISRKLFICSIYIAYNKTIGREFNDNAIIVYPIHSLPKQYAEYLTQDFSSTFFLHMIRNPINLVGSLAKHINNHDNLIHIPLLESAIAQIFNEYTIHSGYYRVYGATAFFKNQSNIQTAGLKLENLHENPEVTLKNLCAWIQIGWDERLLQSTFNDILWHNRPESIQKTGFNNEIISQSFDEWLSSYDKKRLSILANHLLKHFQYPRQSIKKSEYLLILLTIWLPFNMEKIKERHSKQKAIISKENTKKLYKTHFLLNPNITYYYFSVKKYISARLFMYKAYLIQKSKKSYVPLL